MNFRYNLPEKLSGGWKCKYFSEPQAKPTHLNEDNKMAIFVFGPMLHLSMTTSMHDWGAYFLTNI